MEIFLRNDGKRYIGLTSANNEHRRCGFLFIEHWASKEEFENKYSTIDEAHAPDLCIIVLRQEESDSNFQIFKNSTFYELTERNHIETSHLILSGFFRGASTEEEIDEEDDHSNKILPNTGPQIGGGEELQYDLKFQLNYWQIPNPKGFTMNGASGAAFWRTDISSSLNIRFGGVITAGHPKKLYATASDTVWEFLANLEGFKNL